MAQKKRKNETEGIVVLGSTGSIGTSALCVLRENAERFRVAGLSAANSVELLLEQAGELRPEAIALESAASGARAERIMLASGFGEKPRVLHGQDGLEELAAMPGAAKVINALCGAAGIRPSIAAVKAGKTLLMANKESIVAAGEIIFAAARKSGAAILPVDSEHSAVFQCLKNENKKYVRNLILTASGGPFAKRKNTADITPQVALKHPKWKMGRKISIDSATLMNKGLEIIEAMWLFDIPLEKIKVIIHPECVVHSMVEFTDGATIAQMSQPDMKIPIRYALNYPERAVAPVASADLAKLSKLTFMEPDIKRFPCLQLAIDAGRSGGLMPAVLCAADEVAVEAFLDRRIGFNDIPAVIGYALENADGRFASNVAVTLDTVMSADKFARSVAKKAVGKKA